MLPVPKAVLLLRRKRIYDDGALSEVVLWQLPGPVLGSTHLFKYRLFYGTARRQAVGYDNERGKGDHRHLNGVEESYLFVSLDKLLTDFEADVVALQAREE